MGHVQEDIGEGLRLFTRMQVKGGAHYVDGWSTTEQKQGGEGGAELLP